jgi:hypothetical protein
MNLEMLFKTNNNKKKEKREKRKKTRKMKKNKEKDNNNKENNKEKDKNNDIPDFKNETLLKSLKTNKYFYAALIITVILYCKSKKKPFFLSLMSFILMTFLGYLAHVISHHVNMNKIYAKLDNKNFFMSNKYTKKLIKKLCDFMDFHDSIHHDTEINKKPVNIFYEVTNNFLIQGGLMYAVYVASRYIEPEMFLLWAFMYTTIHHINYPIIGSKEHREHHENKFTNYGLDIWDVIFNTKPKPEEGGTPEDFNHIIFNLIVGVAILYFIF